jgi:hypothetical protein
MIRCGLAGLLVVLVMVSGDAHAAGFPLHASVQPATMPYNAHPVLAATAPQGAICMATVVYSTGRRPVSFHGVTITSTGTAAGPGTKRRRARARRPG